MPTRRRRKKKSKYPIDDLPNRSIEEFARKPSPPIKLIESKPKPASEKPELKIVLKESKPESKPKEIVLTEDKSKKIVLKEKKPSET